MVTTFGSLVNQPYFGGRNTYFPAFPPPTNLNAHAHGENTVWFTRLYIWFVNSFDMSFNSRSIVVVSCLIKALFEKKVRERLCFAY